MRNGIPVDEEVVTPTSRLRRAGRPKQRVLTRELIAQGALHLLDTVGEAEFTIARLAKHLKVSPSALYNHFDGKGEVMASVRELISDRIDVSMFQRLPWDEALREWAFSYRAAFAAHPMTIALFATTPVDEAQRTLAMYEQSVGALVAAGWPADLVLSMLVSLESFILGSALDLAAPDDMFDPGSYAAQAPVFTDAFEQRRNRLVGQRPADEAFAIGLDAMLLGLRALHARVARTASH